MPGRFPYEGASVSIDVDVARPGPHGSTVAGSGETTAAVRRAEDVPMERLEAMGDRVENPAIFGKKQLDGDSETKSNDMPNLKRTAEDRRKDSKIREKEEHKLRKAAGDLGMILKTAGDVNVAIKTAGVTRTMFGHSPSMPTKESIAPAAEMAPSLAHSLGYGGRQRSYPEKAADLAGLSSASAAMRGLTEADPAVVSAERNPLRRIALRLTAAKSALEGSRARTEADRAKEHELRQERHSAIKHHGAMLGISPKDHHEASTSHNGVTGSSIHPGDVIGVHAGQNEILIRRSTGQPVLRDSAGNFFTPAPGTLEHHTAVSALDLLTPDQVHEIKTKLGQRKDSSLNRITALLSTLNQDDRFKVLSLLGPLALGVIPAGGGRRAIDTKLGKAFSAALLGTQLVSMLSGSTSRRSGSGLGRNFTSGTSGL